MFMIYLAGAVLLALIAAVTLNKQVGGLAVATVIIGAAVALLFDPNLGAMILKGAFFVIALLLAVRVFTSIAK